MPASGAVSCCCGRSARGESPTSTPWRRGATLMLTCPACSASVFRTEHSPPRRGDALFCGKCAAELRPLCPSGAPAPRLHRTPAGAEPQDNRPPSADWWWLGLVHTDGEWRPVALAPTLGR